MENTKLLNTYYAAYRGYVYLYTPIKAASFEEAEDIFNDMPGNPSKAQQLILASADFDFEIDDCGLMEEAHITFSKVPVALSKAVIKSALTQTELRQTELRQERYKQAKIDSLSNQIAVANAQLLTATKGITDQIDSFKLQLEELSKA